MKGLIMIGSFSSSSAYSSSSFGSTYSSSSSSSAHDSLSVEAMAEVFRKYEALKKLAKPTEQNLSDPEFRPHIKDLFCRIDGDRIGDWSVRESLLDYVAKSGTEKQLNTIFAEMREAGQPAFFPDKPIPNGVDFTIVSRDGAQLTWVTHTDYHLDDSGKFVRDSSEKDNKSNLPQSDYRRRFSNKTLKLPPRSLYTPTYRNI
ncbi:hypothetical protein AAKU67_002469 [Oxalobacteraceae bacterium GrIS 2.11]